MKCLIPLKKEESNLGGFCIFQDHYKYIVRVRHPETTQDTEDIIMAVQTSERPGLVSILITE